MTETSAPTAPELRFLATFEVSVAEAIDVGPTIEGHRRVIPIVGGSVNGPELKGRVLPLGADYQVLRSQTLTELQAQYVVETDSGDRIYVSNFGLRAGSADDIRTLVEGGSVPAERIYFRCSPRLTTASRRWSWLESRILVGVGRRLPATVELDVFVVD
jgi:hypothetical protein